MAQNIYFRKERQPGNLELDQILAHRPGALSPSTLVALEPSYNWGQADLALHRLQRGKPLPAEPLPSITALELSLMPDTNRIIASVLALVAPDIDGLASAASHEIALAASRRQTEVSSFIQGFLGSVDKVRHSLGQREVTGSAGEFQLQEIGLPPGSFADLSLDIRPHEALVTTTQHRAAGAALTAFGSVDRTATDNHSASATGHGAVVLAASSTVISVSERDEGIRLTVSFGRK